MIRFALEILVNLKSFKREGRAGFNPKTGEKVDIPARHVVKFTVSKTMKDSLA